jgi:5-methylcytosine-specific restriction protein A
MTSYFTQYWRTGTGVGSEGEKLEHTAGIFRRRGVSDGDWVFVISMHDRKYILVGRMVVDGPPRTRKEAREEFGEDVWDAPDHLFSRNGEASSVSFERVIPLEVLRALRFETQAGPKPLRFVTKARLDQQTLRGVRRLTRESAELLESLIDDQSRSSSKKVKESPRWTGDELRLVLELYLRKNKAPLGKTSSQVVALAAELNALTSCLQTPKDLRQKTASDVLLKLIDFRNCDSSSAKRRRTASTVGGDVNKEIWEEFLGRRDELFAQCRAIRAAVREVSNDPASPDEAWGFADAPEGRLLTRLHITRERSAPLVNRKKAFARKKWGKLECEVCGFDFEREYGSRGDGFIECHHTKPLRSLGDGHRTTTDDLALLCANCHRMIHTKKPWLSIDELKRLRAPRRRRRAG